ncbi:hypothetical protein ABN250_19680 [Providencia stuartii]|uniref:hypothetical protein n=1 Tax=Providencia stuartii TaxID=588 RepID=UPI0032DB497F
MKNKLNIIMAFLILIVSEQSIAKNVTLTPGSSEATTGRVVASKWLDYQITNGRFIGNLEIRVRLVRAPFYSGSAATTYNLSAQGSPLTVTPCISNDAGYGGCYHRTPFPVVGCTSADQGDINICMNRIVGTEGTIVIPVNEPTYQLSSPNFCMRSYLQYPDVKAPSPVDILSIYFDPYTVCGEDNGAPPPIPELTGSVCNLNSQNLNLNYSSTSLNVGGITKSTSLNVSCTTGVAQDYQLKLTGSNVVSGRLNFGNGVSAQVSLNGIQVQANGPGIQLNNLVSQTIPVSATLMGNASVSGVSKATGILVLEAL